MQGVLMVVTKNRDGGRTSREMPKTRDAGSYKSGTRRDGIVEVLRRVYSREESLQQSTTIYYVMHKII